MIEGIASSESSSTDHIHWWWYWNIYQRRALFKRIPPDCSHRCRNRHHFERRTATEKKTGQLRLLSQELRFARANWLIANWLLFSRHNTRWKQPCPIRPLKKGLPRRAAKRRGKKRRLLFLPLTKESSVERATRIRWMQRIQFQWQMEELRCMEATSIHWTCFIQSAAKKKTEDQLASKTNNRWMHTCQSSQQKREWWHRAKSNSLQMRLRQSRELRKELLHEKVKCTYWMWTDLFFIEEGAVICVNFLHPSKHLGPVSMSGSDSRSSKISKLFFSAAKCKAVTLKKNYSSISIVFKISFKKK